MQTFIAFLNDVPLAGLMLVVALGYTLGRQSVRGITLGPAGGTLAVALLIGAMGLSFHDMYGSDDPHLTLGTLGFALFIYSVGLEAGPRFFNSLLGGAGWKIAAVCLTVNLLAVAIAIVCGLLFGLDDSVTAGVLSGGADQRTDVCRRGRGLQQSGGAHAQLRANVSFRPDRHGVHGDVPASRDAG